MSTSESPRAIAAVVLATGLNGLGATRSLGEAGIPHVVLYTGETNPTQYSRYAAHTVQVPSRATDADLVAAISAATDRVAAGAGRGAAIFGCSDAHIDFLARQRDVLMAAGYAVICPPGDVSEVLNDKSRELAVMSGLAVDMRRSLQAPLPDAQAMVEALGLPIIIKPRSYKYASLITTKNVIMRDHAELAAFLATHAEHLDGFVAQEVIEGPDDALWVCNCLFGDAGVLQQAFTFQRLRTSPPHFGVTSFAIGRDNVAIKRMCATIGAALKYTGPAMIEFKYDAATNRYCYIETNPRLGMCNILDTRSGVNNVANAVRVARGEPLLASMTQQRDGVYYLNSLSDLDSRLGDGESLWTVLRSHLATVGSPHAWAYFSWRDPWPWARTVVQQVGSTSRRIVRRLLR